MYKFTTILATTAFIAQETAAMKTFKDPLNLSQVQSQLNKGANQNAQQFQLSQTNQETVVTEPAVAEVAEPALDADSVKKGNCVSNITSNFMLTSDQDKTTSLSQFNNYVDVICPALDMRVPNGVITASCFHSGYFLLKTLRPLAEASILPESAASADSFSDHVDHFCSNYVETMPERTAFVKAIRNIEDDVSFATVCTDHLSTHPNLNAWYDPIDPLSSITQREICDLHFKLFDSLRDKQRTSLAEYVSFSYLASLDLFLNAQAQEDFENCVNAEVLQNANQWATSFTTAHSAFKNWDANSKIEQSAAAGVAVVDQCADQKTCMETGACKTCDGCSIAISQIYTEYEGYLNNLFAETFKTHSEQMFDQLHQANLALEVVPAQ